MKAISLIILFAALALQIFKMTNRNAIYKEIERNENKRHSMLNQISRMINHIEEMKGK